MAALFVPPANAEHLMAAVSSLQRVGVTVIAGGPSGESILPFRDAGCQCLLAGNTADLINQTWVHHHLPVLAVGDAVTVPDNFLGPALRLLADDLRVATVSFLSNDAGFLSFPAKNDPINRVPEGHDCTSVTRRLRDLGPHEPATPSDRDRGRCPALPFGSRTDRWSDSRAAWHFGRDAGRPLGSSEVAGVHPPSGRLDLLRSPPGRREWTPGHRNGRRPGPSRAALGSHLLSERSGIRRPRGELGHGSTGDGARFGAGQGARTPSRRRRSYLGPHEMGTQVTILANVEALSRRDDVREVVVALRSDIPPYAVRTLSLPKVVARAVDFDRLEGLGRCNVAHRMMQPDRWFSVDRWRTVADRVVVTVHDLIAYRNGAYHEDWKEWLSYREALRSGSAAADAVVVVSDDVKLQAEIERLPVDPQRLHTIPNGTEHLAGDERTEMPPELVHAALSKVSSSCASAPTTRTRTVTLPSPW